MDKTKSPIKKLILHHSLSDFGSAALIRKWHLEKGFDDIGYHYVICNGQLETGLYLASMDGSIEVGRPIDIQALQLGETIGAHAYGHNRDSIGVCLIGNEYFTPKQLGALVPFVLELCHQYNIDPEAGIIGHNQTEHSKRIGKLCPHFSVEALVDLIKSAVR